jgi:hypothetical protein
MHKPRFLVIMTSVLVCFAMFATRSLYARPSPAGFPASDSKKDCPKSADGKTPKDCSKLDPSRMSTNMKGQAKAAGSSADSSKSGANASKADAGKLSDERMSTRGLKPPPKDQTTKPDTKTATAPDSANPK